MTSTGNDIVSLQKIDKERTAQYRFYSKILVPAERDLFDHAPLAIPFENYVWLLWSVKESAYKYFQRLESELLFSPLKFVVSEINIQQEKEDSTNTIFTGRVIFDNHTLYFLSDYNEVRIHTIVHHENNFDKIRSGITEIQSEKYADQSAAAKELLKQDLEKYFTGKILIEKSEAGYPEVFCDGKKMDMAVSLSHDGFWVGWVVVGLKPNS
ncbi:MAG: 4'-phosphopantetheinyl transferase superfamily protein [Chitinophagaceae bacterium]